MDDESLCGYYQCPKACECYGFVVFCKTIVKLQYFPIEPVVLFLRNINSEGHDLLFSKNSSLVVMDLSNSIIFNNKISIHFFNNISNLEILNLTNTALRSLHNSPFHLLHQVVLISLQRNDIPILHRNAFVGLTKLDHLNLSDMNIRKIYSATFKNLKSLIMLNISMNRLRRIPQHAFDELLNLQQLDVSNNNILDVQDDAFTALSNTIVFTNKENLCCFVPSKLNCVEIGHVTSTINACQPLIGSTILHGVYWFVGIVSIIAPICVIVIQVACEKFNAQVLTIIQLSCCNFLIGIILIILAIVQCINGKMYPLKKMALYENFICQVESFIIILTHLVPKGSFMIIACIYHRITTGAMIKRPYTVKQIGKCMCVGWLIFVTIACSWTVYVDEFRTLLCFPFSKKIFRFYYVACILLIFLDVTMFLATFVIFVVILKHLRLEESKLTRSNYHKKLTSTTVSHQFIIKYTLNMLTFSLQLAMICCSVLLPSQNTYLISALFVSSVFCDTVSQLYLYTHKTIRSIL